VEDLLLRQFFRLAAVVETIAPGIVGVPEDVDVSGPARQRIEPCRATAERGLLRESVAPKAKAGDLPLPELERGLVGVRAVMQQLIKLMILSRLLRPVRRLLEHAERQGADRLR
jgi:hypothetical protein